MRKDALITEPNEPTTKDQTNTQHDESLFKDLDFAKGAGFVGVRDVTSDSERPEDCVEPG